jgi:hypothetical protein
MKSASHNNQSLDQQLVNKVRWPVPMPLAMPAAAIYYKLPLAIVIYKRSFFIVDISTKKRWRCGMPYIEVINKPLFEVLQNSGTGNRKIITRVYQWENPMLCMSLEHNTPAPEKHSRVFSISFYNPFVT